MAINYGLITNQRTAADEYAGQAAMMPDLGAEFEKGQQRAQALQDRERRIKYDELKFAQAKLDYDTDLDEFDQMMKGRADLDNQLIDIASASSDMEQDVCTRAAIISGAASSKCTPDLPEGWQSWSDSRKQQALRSLQMVDAQKKEGYNIAQQYTPQYFADNGIDPKDPANQEKVLVAQNMQGAIKGNKRTIKKDGQMIEVYDLKVPIGEGKYVTIPNGDVATYFDGFSKSPSVTNIDGAVKFDTLLGATGNEFVNEQALETKRDEFLNLFSGDNPTFSLSSFASRFKDPTGGEWTTEDAWTVYKAAKIAEIKESGNYGVPSGFQKTQDILKKNDKELSKLDKQNVKLDEEINRLQNPVESKPTPTGSERIIAQKLQNSQNKKKKFLDTLEKPEFKEGGGDLSQFNNFDTSAGTISKVEFVDGKYVINWVDRGQDDPISLHEFKNTLDNILEIPATDISGYDFDI